MANLIRRLRLWLIERRGRSLGAPTIRFDEREIIAPGRDLDVRYDIWRFLTGVSAFYLPLPPNTYGIVIFPDGTTRNLAGGLHEVRSGLYKLQYVDKHERFDFTAPITEIALDGEILTLRVLVQYRVIDPLIVLKIDRPIETLMENIQSDLAQYVRSHNHADIINPADAEDRGRILQHLIQKHLSRHPLSRAIAISGIEIKEYAGDQDYISQRRSYQIRQREDLFDRAQLDRKKEIERMRAEHKVELEKLNAKAAAESAALRNEILYESQKRDILLDEMRQQSKRRHELVVKAMDAISEAMEHSMYSRNASSEIRNNIKELLAAIGESRPDTGQTAPPGGAAPAQGGAPPAQAGPQTSGNEKIERLTNSLLSLLRTQK
ncbi:MAG: hypothetical protein HND47_22180 [Chloroflexi bacterium]|nr:hypothetical protein [Chloroflexota bacterium]